MYHRVRKLYIKYLRNRIKDPLHAQRLKLLWFAWGYWGILIVSALPIFTRLKLIYRFLIIDWMIPHGHRPHQIAKICKALFERPLSPGHIMIEAGCWQGGSSCKFSLMCDLSDCYLHIYDSFEGVEPIKEDGYYFGGLYKASEDQLWLNLRKYGTPGLCVVHKGWFADTLAGGAPAPVWVAYIDCDLAKGTKEALEGILPALADGATVFSQDYHIHSVREMLNSPTTWNSLGHQPPKWNIHDSQLASFRHCS